jgi:methyltransferase (TIGR00027 family)
MAEGFHVAAATLTYFARRSTYLRPADPTQRPSVLLEHSTRASARLIAGLRALEQQLPAPRFDNPYSMVVAGAHCRLLAEEFRQVLPELQEFVVARARDLDDLVRDALRRSVEQFVFVGVGLDCRPFRLLADQPSVTVYELDLAGMLPHREAALKLCTDLPSVHRRQVAIDLEYEDVYAAMLEAGFDSFRPALFIFEGASMYFAARTNQRIFCSIARCMNNVDSQLWFDVVANRVVSHSSGFAQVEAFVRGMSRIGEPFVFGLDDPSGFLNDLGLEIVQTTPAVAYAGQPSNRLFFALQFPRRAPSLGMSVGPSSQGSDHQLLVYCQARSQYFRLARDREARAQIERMCRGVAVGDPQPQALSSTCPSPFGDTFHQLTANPSSSSNWIDPHAKQCGVQLCISALQEPSGHSAPIFAIDRDECHAHPAGRASTSPLKPVFGWRLLLLLERYFEGFWRVCKSAQPELTERRELVGSDPAYLHGFAFSWYSIEHSSSEMRTFEHSTKIDTSLHRSNGQRRETSALRVRCRRCS